MHISYKYHKIILLVFNMLIAGSIYSQDRYTTTILPEEDITIPKTQGDHYLKISKSENETLGALLKFNLNHLPKNIKITSLKLKLYLSSGGNDNPPGQRIYLYTVKEKINSKLSLDSLDNIKNKSTAVYEMPSKKKKTSTIEMNFSKEKVKEISTDTTKRILFLVIKSATEKDQPSKFYSTKLAEDTDEFSKKPKLLVTYEIENSPHRLDWAQSFANAQHNGYYDWTTSPIGTTAILQNIKLPKGHQIVGADQIGAISIYNNKPIVLTQSAIDTPNFYVNKLNLGDTAVWNSVPVDDIAICNPVIDEHGRLHYLSLKKFTLLDLTSKKWGNELISKTVSELTNKQIVTSSNKSTLGYDGTLYIVGKGTDEKHRIIALSAYPELKIKWIYNSTTKEKLLGSVSLSPDESKAFFIEVDKGHSRLIVLDNIDGTTLSTSDYVLDGYKKKDSKDSYLVPHPVIQNNARVFVLNGYRSSNLLFIFDISNKGKITKSDTISSGNTVNKKISQPVVLGKNADHVFFIYNQKLARYDSLSPKKVHEFEAADKINNASTLLTDKSNNIYVLDVKKSKKAYGFTYQNQFKQTYTTPLSGLEGVNENFALAPDGTLYATGKNNLSIITPVPLKKELKLKSIHIKSTYRASEKIMVEKNVQIEKRVNTILYSHGSISFESGFGVTKGAQLTCKTGKIKH
ncbi:hypothetical protein ATE84_2611 [Aquimarina sp. MAR_2010_214]|uniref:DNRLRE domain-containing protein n=1 Tax=Aquimarina sp. MAR_2010_214 TaxID=1250026 RepID=UPI000C712F9F|nr:DNRLRE domain-containing protein [Aquimarina sp. MAR_2010_214]PKV50552.1 hypothetical protein ATE84_2611 [Aquimarina sp. MAR_2010_214]